MINYYYEDSYIFDVDKTPGLNLAFGITYYDNNPEPIDIDPDYGEILGQIKTWGDNEFTKFTKLNMRPCTYEELGLEERDGKYYSKR